MALAVVPLALALGKAKLGAAAPVAHWRPFVIR